MDNSGINVLLLSPLPPPIGGMGSWTLSYQSAAEALGWKVHIVDIAPQGKRRDNLHRRPSAIEELKRLINVLKQIRIAKNNKLDVIHMNTSCNRLGIIRDAYVCRVLHKMNIPLVVQCHCNIKDQIGELRVSHLALKYILKHADNIVVLNRSSLCFLQNSFVPYRKKYSLVPNFITEDKVLDRHEIREKIEKCVYVGHVTSNKGISEIIKLSNYFDEIEFLIVGRVFSEYADIETPDNLRMIGEVDKNDVKGILASADFFLFPSHSEGFSMALLEAMASGLPVVATDVGANMDMIENKGGIIVKSGDVAALRTAILEMGDASRRTIMSQWNIDKVKNSYTDRKVIMKLENIYRGNIRYANRFDK